MRSLSVSSQHLKFQIFHNFLRGVGGPFLRDCLYTSPADLLIEFLKKGFNFRDLHDVFRVFGSGDSADNELHNKS